MSINSGGKPYNPNFPVPNVNNDSKGFRENFATIKFAVEALQIAASGPSSVLKLAASPQSNGTVLLTASFKDTGFTLPVRPANPLAGTIASEGGQLFFWTGTVWQNFIPLVGDTLTIQNIVVNNRLTLNFTPSEPSDAVSKAWVENFVSNLPSGGVDGVTLNRISALEQGLDVEATARIDGDDALALALGVERDRIDQLSQDFGDFANDLAGIETNVNNQLFQITDTAQNTANTVAALEVTVTTSLQDFADNLQAEIQARINGDADINARIDLLDISNIVGLGDALNQEIQDRINGDAHVLSQLNNGIAILQQSIDNQGNTIAGYNQLIGNASANASAAWELANTFGGAITDAEANAATAMSIAVGMYSNIANVQAAADGAAQLAEDAMDLAQDAMDLANSTASSISNFLNVNDGGDVFGDVTFVDSDVVVSGGSFTLQGAEFYMPESNVVVDAGNGVFFRKLPNTVGSGDGAFLTYDEHNQDYAFMNTGTQAEYDAELLANGIASADAMREFSVFRIGVTNDPANGNNDDSLALEPAAHLFLNPGYAGASAEKYGRTRSVGHDANSAVYVGSARDWTVEINRSTGNIHTKGDIHAEGSIQTDVGIVQPSDLRLKTDLVAIDNALDKIDALNGYTYSYINDESRRRHSGLIAQDVEEVLPEAVRTDEITKNLLLNYMAIVPLLVEGMKALRKEVEELKEGR